MASTRKLNTKDGTPFYEVTVSRGRGVSRLTSRWYPPAGWSQRAIDRELTKVAAEFERKVKAGEVLTRQEEKGLEHQRQLEAAQIQTLRQYCESVFMPAITIKRSENTRASYQGSLNNWIYPALGEYKLPEITTAQIEALLASMQEKKKSHGTVIKIYTILLGIFKRAYKADVIDRNPMDKVDRPEPRKDEIKRDSAPAYTVEEIRHILTCLENEPLKWRALMRLLIDTGIRRGECCGLQWADIDFKGDTITIRRSLSYTKEKGIYIDTTKNSKIRTIDVDPAVMVLLRQLRQEQARSAISRFVFTQDGSPEPMHPQSPTRFMQKFAKRNNIQDLHPHKLRHSFASIAITHGADVASVSEKLGHSDKAVTLRMYTHADQESIKRASNIFREALKQAK